MKKSISRLSFENAGRWAASCSSLAFSQSLHSQKAAYIMQHLCVLDQAFILSAGIKSVPVSEVNKY
jgi:hypothetical protein